MNYSVYDFTLDLQQVQAQVSLYVKFGDTGRKLRITVTDGGNPYTFTKGSYAVISGRKADKKYFLNECAIDLTSMAILYTFTEQTALSEGVTECEIIIYGADGTVIGSPRFVLIVDKRLVYDEDLFEDSENEKNIITNSLAVLKSSVKDELSRDAAETVRQNNEAARVAAEELRVEADAKRTTYIPSISNDGVLSWTNDKNLPNPDPVSLVQWLNTLPKAEEEVF